MQPISVRKGSRRSAAISVKTGAFHAGAAFRNMRRTRPIVLRVMRTGAALIRSARFGPISRLEDCVAWGALWIGGRRRLRRRLPLIASRGWEGLAGDIRSISSARDDGRKARVYSHKVYPAKEA